MKVRVLIALAVGMLAAALTASMATAADPRVGGGTADPLTSNVPYTAWTGQSLRLVKCFDGKPGNDEATLRSALDATIKGNFVVEDWSGVTLPVTAGPRFLSGNTNGDTTDADPFIQWNADRGFEVCFAAVATSQKPGLAVVKLALDAEVVIKLRPWFELQILDGVTVVEHQFLAIWMHIQKPTLEELPFGGDANHLNNWYLDESTAPGRMKIRVKGTFPLGNNFSGMVPGNVVTLPDQWGTLAGGFAFDKWHPSPGTAAFRWDIHDDNNPPPAVVSSGNSLGPFDTIFGPTSGNVVGPFDPIYPLSTLLSDGKVDADDANMPAARVDVSITNNSGQNGDVSGAGKLIEVRKTDHYRTPDGKTYYAPFYMQYIPATMRGGDASGTHSGYGNNFPTLQNGPYWNWDIVQDLSETVAHLARTNGSNRCRDELGGFRKAPNENRPPGGYVVVFTDEHGEAIVGFDPDAGFYHVIDANNRCDLDLLPKKVIGTAEIKAEAIYPGQPVFNQPRAISDPLVKVIHHGASKLLDCVPKGPFEAFCVETIKDIYGRPVAGAKVEFSRNPHTNGIRPEALVFGGFDTRGQMVVPDRNQFAVTLKTNDLGQAGVLITNTRAEKVDITSENVGTRLDDTGARQAQGVIRVRCLTFAGNGVTMPTDAATCEAPPAGAPPVTMVVLGGPLQSYVNPAVAGKAPGAKSKMAIHMVRYIKTKAGKRLAIRLSGPNKTGLVRIVLLGKKGKVVKVVVRRIKTGKLVILSDVSLARVASVRIALMR